MKTDKLIILWTLGCSENETLLRGYLENSLNEESVGKDDVALVITAVVANKIGFALATQFLEENFKAIYDK